MTTCHWCHDPLDEHDTTIDDTGRTVRVCRPTVDPVPRDIVLGYITLTREHISTRHDGAPQDRCPLCQPADQADDLEQSQLPL